MAGRKHQRPRQVRKYTSLAATGIASSHFTSFPYTSISA
jgi:hypothetical protein